MPRDVAVVLPGRRVAASEIATAITVARSLIASGRHVTFYHGYRRCRNSPSATTTGAGRAASFWSARLPTPSASSISPVATVAGDPGSVRHARRRSRRRVRRPCWSPTASWCAPAACSRVPCWPPRRGIDQASVGEAAPVELPTDRVTFDQLARAAGGSRSVRPRRTCRRHRHAAACRPERGRRGFCSMSWWRPTAPARRRWSAPSSTSACSAARSPRPAKPTHLDLPAARRPGRHHRQCPRRRAARQRAGRLPLRAARLSGANSRLVRAGAGRRRWRAARFLRSDVAVFASGSKFCCRRAPPISRIAMLGMVSEVASSTVARCRAARGRLHSPAAARRCRMGPSSPSAIRRRQEPTPRVRFDRGRVAVTDRAGRTLLDLGGFVGGAVAQIVAAGDYPGLWIKPLSADRSTAGAAGASSRSRRRRLRRWQRRGAGDVDRARYRRARFPIRTRCRGSPSPNVSAPGSSPACGCSRPRRCC